MNVFPRTHVILRLPDVDLLAEIIVFTFATPSFTEETEKNVGDGVSNVNFIIFRSKSPDVVAYSVSHPVVACSLKIQIIMD